MNRQASTSAGKTLLVIGAHMDDCEAGAGGTIFKAIDQGLRVVLVNTIGDYSNRTEMAGADVQAQRKRVVDLAARMGARKVLLNYKYHQYPDTLEARKEMARIVADVRPDVAIIHNCEDYWVDHRITGLVARDALLFASGLLDGREDVPMIKNIYAFVGGQNQTHAFEGDTFVDVTPYIDRIAQVRCELDRIMSPSVPEEKWFRQHVRTFHPVDPSLNREMKLTAHAETQLARLRHYGARAAALYAEPFLAVFKRTTDLW
jgi:LmbE family N-acetylglucosaminyl deacetylase